MRCFTRKKVQASRYSLQACLDTSSLHRLDKERYLPIGHNHPNVFSNMWAIVVKQLLGGLGDGESAGVGAGDVVIGKQHSAAIAFISGSLVQAVFK